MLKQSVKSSCDYEMMLDVVDMGGRTHIFSFLHTLLIRKFTRHLHVAYVLIYEGVCEGRVWQREGRRRSGGEALLEKQMVGQQ